MSKRSDFVFIVLKIFAWIIFVGLSIEAGALIVNFAFSLFNPEVVHNLYEKLDLSGMYEKSRMAYFGMYSFIIVISFLKAVLFFIVIRLLSKLDLKKPFSNYVSGQISLISYYTFAIGILSYIARQTTQALLHHGFETDGLDRFWADSKAFILMAAVIYVIATIFSRGVELQNENELTV